MAETGRHCQRSGQGDLIPRRGEGPGRRPAPLSEDLGRALLYARYNAELSRGWPDARGLAKEVRHEHFALERFGRFY